VIILSLLKFRLAETGGILNVEGKAAPRCGTILLSLIKVFITEQQT
jgi:hypothetical protein